MNREAATPPLAARFVLGTATVKRWVAQQRRDGHVEPKPKAGGTPSPIRGATVDALITALGDPTANKLTAAYNRTRRSRRRVHVSSVKRALHRHDYVVKKMLPAAGSGSARRPGPPTSVPEGHPSDYDRPARVSGRIRRPSRHAPHAHLGKGGTEYVERVPVNWGRTLTLLGACGTPVGWSCARCLPPPTPTASSAGSRDTCCRNCAPAMSSSWTLGTHHDRRVRPACRRRGIRVVYLPPYSPDRTLIGAAEAGGAEARPTYHVPPIICDGSRGARAIGSRHGTAATGLRMRVTELNSADPWD
jgi:transposase